MIKAITFDLWDTVLHDDSDEPKRAADGLRSKRLERRHVLWESLNSLEAIDSHTVSMAYDVMEAAFNNVWKDHYITWTVAERIKVVLRGLNRELPEREFRQIVDAHEQMEVEYSPDLVPGIDHAIADLATRYQLGVVSDAIVCPGRGLRQILEKHGVARHFSGFAFSDEVGHSKPHRAMFVSAAQQLGVEIDHMVHIGDRDHNDIKGSHALGMQAVLITATRPHDKDITLADAICEDALDLPAIIDELAAGN